MDLNQAFAKPINDVFKELDASEQGLDSKEIESRKKQYGKNVLEEQEKRSLLSILLSQFANPVVYLLLAAVVVSFIFSDFPEAIAIIIVIILNAAIGFWMEYKAQVSLQALKKIDPLTVKVRRNDKEQSIKSKDLVPGDLIVLEAGNIVPADARIISCSECKADESPLTGESVAMEKEPGQMDQDIQLPDRSNMLYKGTALVTGKADALVTATGMDTEIGNISRMVSDAGDKEVPLNRKLSRLANRLIYIILGLSALFFVFGWLAGKELYLMLQTAIAWAVAAIPEGLPIVTSISLARGMLRLAKKNVIVQKLAAVETLGETTLILTDKTGTLTKNQLTLANAEFLDGQENLEEIENTPSSEAFDHFYRISVLCNDAVPDNGGYKGDPLDAALMVFARELDGDRFKNVNDLKRINEDPFDSEAMFMGTVHETGNGLYIAAKGASEAILDRCTHYFDQGETKETGPDFTGRWRKKDKELSASGMKVIAFAFREEPPERRDELEGKDDFVEKMIFLGLAGFIDPVRPEVIEPIGQCHKAGIKVVMVTGDHPETALNIAKRVKITEGDGGKVFHGKDLKGEHDFSNVSVFARVNPSQKLDIVEYFQDKKEIVGMTGDGVNDAPALKKANIGIAMGKRGTQVAREVSDMVLKDDAFSSIVHAIEQGRTIFENIKKFIMYQLSYHLAEIIIIASISFTMFILPLYPLQLLFINLLSDVFPALALGLGKGTPAIMDKMPKDSDEPVITKRDWMVTVVYGIVIAVFVIAAFVFSSEFLNLSSEVCNNITFFSLAFGQLLHTFNMRSPEEPIFNNQITQNHYVWLAIGFCTAVLITAYFVPVLSHALSFVVLSGQAWLIIAATSVLMLLVNQIIKQIWKL